mgnify:CR=1 FL=1
MHIRIEIPDDSLADALRASVGNTLGRVGNLAVQIGLAQGSLQPQMHRPAIVLFAGDHGAIAAGASARPQKITWQSVERVVAGRAPINLACRQMALGLSVVDAGVSHDFGTRAGLVDAKIEHGTANFGLEPAMWRSQLERALERGRALAHEYAALGCSVIGFGSIGVGARASAALLTHCLTDLPLNVLSSPDDAADAVLTRRRALLDRALARAGRPADAFEALREFGGFEIAMMSGAMLGAAERRLLVVVDGFVASSALLAARGIAPEVVAYATLADRSAEPGHAHQAAALGLEPLLDLGLAGGDGVAAALAMPLLRTAAACPGVAAGVAPAGRDSQSP